MYGSQYIGANDTYALDNAQDNKLVFAVAEDLTADRQLDITVSDANRALDLTPTADYGLMYDSGSATWMAKDIVATLTSIFKADGSRNVTGQLTSTYAAGAPFVVADTTVVASLNSDLLDGNHANAFATAAHTHTFLNLTDVPASYAGETLKLVRVNAGETALEFTAAVTTTFLALTDVPASYATHGDKTVMVNTGETALEFLGPWLDQDVRVAASPTFGGLTVDGSVAFTSCATFAISDSPGNTSVTMDGTLSVGSTCNIVGLLTISGEALTSTTGKLYLDNVGQWVNAPSATEAQLNAVTTVSFGVGGVTQAEVLDDEFKMYSAVGDVSLAWSTTGELEFQVSGTGQVVFANGAIFGTTDSDIDLGKETTNWFKDAYFKGSVYFSTTGEYISNTGIGVLTAEVASTFRVSIGSTDQVVFTNGAIHGSADNDIDLGVSGGSWFKDAYFKGVVYFDDTDTTIKAVSGDLLRNVASGKTHSWLVGLTAEMFLDSNKLTLAQGPSSVAFDFATAAQLDLVLSGTTYFEWTSAAFLPTTTKVTDMGSDSQRFDLTYTQVVNVLHATNPSTEEGNFWYNEATNTHRIEAADAIHNVVGGESLLTSDSLVINLSSKVYFSGTKDIAANSLVVGSSYEFVASGSLTCGATITYTWTADLDSVEVVDYDANTQTSVSGQAWEIRGQFTVRSIGATGTVQGGGSYGYPRGGGNVPTSTTLATVDTTQALTFRVSVQMSVASFSHSCTCEQIILKKVS